MPKGADNEGQVLDKVPGPQVRFETQERPDLLGGVVTVKVVPDGAGDALTCIPYYAWCHRGQNEMAVWFLTKPEDRLASHCWGMDSVEACFDGREPKNFERSQHPAIHLVGPPRQRPNGSNAGSSSRRRSRPSRSTGSTTPATARCRVPAELAAAVQGRQGVEAGGGRCRVRRRNATSTTGSTFTPVTTTALRLEVSLQPGFSGGVLEWKTE